MTDSNKLTHQSVDYLRYAYDTLTAFYTLLRMKNTTWKAIDEKIARKCNAAELRFLMLEND